MVGRSIEQLGDRQTGQQNQVRISPHGLRQIAQLQEPLFRAVVGREELPAHEREAALNGLNLQRLRG